jgi:hypothetical protein
VTQQLTRPAIYIHTPHRARVSTTNGAAATAGDTTALPVVKIDNRSDPFATIVSVEFGDRLGELLDTVRAAAPGVR